MTTNEDAGSARKVARDIAVDVVVVRPGRAAAQGQDRILHRERLVAAKAEFAARERHILGRIGQCEGWRTDKNLLGIGRQAEVVNCPAA